jgi:hypothetical protein
MADINVLVAPGYIHAEGETEEAGELCADTEREHLHRAEAFLG